MGPATLAETGRAHASSSAEQLVEAQGRLGWREEIGVGLEQTGRGQVADGALDRVPPGEAVAALAELAHQFVEAGLGRMQGEDVLEEGGLERRVDLGSALDVSLVVHRFPYK